MSSSHWIPRKGADFVAMCNKWDDMLSDEEKVAAFMWLASLIAVVLAKIHAFFRANDAYVAVSSVPNRRARKDAMREATKAMQDFAASSIRNNPFMTQADRVEMGLHAPDATHTVHPRPTEVPSVVVRPTAFHYQHRVEAHCSGMRKHSKPEGVHGVHFAWQIGGVEPASGKGMAESRFSRRPTIIVEFDAADRGKSVFYSACYENAKGEAGKWSPVVEWVIG